jgi:hypothetical protein
VRGEDFHGDVAIEARIARAVDLAHASGAEGRQDLVGPETGSVQEWQGLSIDMPRADEAHEQLRSTHPPSARPQAG